MIGFENSRHSLYQSGAKLKSITTWSPAFSRALGSLAVFTFSSHWLLKVSSFLLIGHYGQIGFCQTSLNRNAPRTTAILGFFRPSIESYSYVVQNELIFTYSKWVSPRVFGKTQKSSSKWWNLKLRDKIWEILFHCKLLSEDIRNVKLLAKWPRPHLKNCNSPLLSTSSSFSFLITVARASTTWPENKIGLH